MLKYQEKKLWHSLPKNHPHKMMKHNAKNFWNKFRLLAHLFLKLTFNHKNLKKTMIQTSTLNSLMLQLTLEL